MRPRLLHAALIGLALAAAGPLLAQTTTMADGEVRTVNKDAKKLTIRHGPIPSLEMGAMTMVFQVSDPAILDQVKAGDKIRFAAEKVKGAYTVTKVEPAQ